MPGESVARVNDLGISDLERVHALFANPGLYTLTDGYPKPDRTRGGRPKIYPDYLIVGLGGLARIYKSHRAATTALHGPVVWDYIREVVRQQHPDDATKWLPEKPPSRTWLNKARDRLTQAGLDPLQEAFSDSGVATAHELGLLDPDGPGTATHPDASRMLYFDGKAIRQMYNGAPGDTRDVRITDPDTGATRIEQRPVRADADAKVHTTGDNRQIHGCKFVRAEVRGTDRYARVYLAVDHAPTEKGAKNSEADIALKMLLALAPSVPGAQGVMSDTVLRGTHIDTIVRATGWNVMNPVSAKAVNKKTAQRTEKELPLRTETFEYDDGSSEDVDIWISGGRLVQLIYTDDGTEALVPLKRVRNLSAENKNGEYRAYVEYEVPDPLGGDGRTIREPILRRADDAFNRPENIRQIPPGDPDYIRLIGRRSDAESANRSIDDDLYLRRATSLGARRQLFDLLCHAFIQNSVARYRRGSRAGPPAALAA